MRLHTLPAKRYNNEPSPRLPREYYKELIEFYFDELNREVYEFKPLHWKPEYDYMSEEWLLGEVNALHQDLSRFAIHDSKRWLRLVDKIHRIHMKFNVRDY